MDTNIPSNKADPITALFRSFWLRLKPTGAHRKNAPQPKAADSSPVASSDPMDSDSVLASNTNLVQAEQPSAILALDAPDNAPPPLGSPWLIPSSAPLYRYVRPYPPMPAPRPCETDANPLPPTGARFISMPAPPSPATQFYGKAQTTEE
jgi:hypothetical protein